MHTNFSMDPSAGHNYVQGSKQTNYKQLELLATIKTDRTIFRDFRRNQKRTQKKKFQIVMLASTLSEIIN